MLAGDAVGVLNQTLLGLAAFHGLARENMTRAQAWRFLDMGLRLERAVYLGTLLDATLRSPEAENPSVLEAVLEVADSSITFARATTCCRTVPAVFDLVLLDDKNPRSVLFQINQLAQHFEHLPREREDGGRVPAKAFCRMPRALTQPTRANWPRSSETWREQRSRRGHPAKRCATCRNFPTPSPRAISRTRRFRAPAGKRAMNYSITHRTLYEYAAPVTVSHHVARLEPRVTAAQACERFSLKIFPEPDAAQDAHGLFRQPALLFQHPGNPQPAGNHHAQPRDGARPQTARARSIAGVGRRRRTVPRPGFAGSRRAVSICFRFAAGARVVGIGRLRARKFSRRDTPLLAGRARI